MLDNNSVITALKTVFDPEIDVNIYDLGLIYNINIVENIVHITMLLFLTLMIYGTLKN